MVKFTSTIYKIGINPVVDPPSNVLDKLFAQAGRSKGPVPVRGKLNGADFVQTLVKYQGAWRLYINGPMLKESGLQVDDKADIEIEFDPTAREVETPAGLISALRRDRVASAAYENLPRSRKNEISKYLNSLKTEASVERNIERVIRHLRDEDTDAQYGMMRRKQNKK